MRPLGRRPGIHNPQSWLWIPGSRQEARPGMTALIFRRLWPRPLRAAHGLEGPRHSQHADVVEAAADNLHADRETRLVITAIDRERGVFRHIPRHRVADMLERFCRIVDRRSQ